MSSPHLAKVRIVDLAGDSVMDETNDALRVNVVAGGSGPGGSGTEYTEGDTDASITGTAIMWEDTGDALVAVSAAKPLPVDLGANNDVTVTSGTVNVGTSGLPSGASTLAEQQTQTASLSVLDDWDESDRAKVNSIAGQVGVQGGSGAVSALTQRVVLATDVALPTGSNAIGKLAANSGIDIGDVDVTSVAGTVTVGGTAAHASPTSGSPVYVAGRASNVVPTDVGADGDAAGLWLNRNGAQVVAIAPHVGYMGSPWTMSAKTAQYSSTQTSAVLLAGGASEKIVVTSLQIQAGGTTAGTLQVYFGTGAYSRGTNLALFDGEFAPSATLKPGVIMNGPFISSTNGDDVMVTESANINPLTITIWYYLVT